MLISQRRLKAGLCLLLLFGVLFFLPIFPGVSTYEKFGQTIDGDQFTLRGFGPRYIRRGDDLYLLRYRTWHAVILVTLLQQVNWSPEDQNAILKSVITK